MNVQRSPPLTQSQPDLSKIGVSQTSTDNTAVRKRKRSVNHDDLRTDFKDFRQEIISILSDFTQKQNAKMDNIAEDISTIKDQINNIQQKTEQLVLEQDKLKTEVAELRSNANDAAIKVNALETNVRDLQASITPGLPTALQMALTCDDMLQEINERCVREKNIIVIGLPEPQSTDQQERAASDAKEVEKLIKMTDANCPHPKTNMRLGKYMPGKVRPIKATFNDASTVKTILKNRTKINRSDVKIYSDRTPYQQNHMKKLKEELQARTCSGETNLGIKYVKGVPKIVDFSTSTT